MRSLRICLPFFCGLALGLLSGQAHGQAVVERPATTETWKFKPAPGPLQNPLKGWCPYTDAGDIHQPYSMVFLYVPWKQLEPRPGEYAFAAWEEQAWKVPRAEGKHIVFRVYIDYPQLPSGLPDWLADAGVKQTPYDDHGGGLSPDYEDPRLVESLERLIAALGKRYNDHPRVAFIQIGLLGFWGEWHTWPRDELAASPATERRILEAYRRAFPDKSLMVRYARGPAADLPWIGFHDDMFPADTDNGEDWSFLSGLRRAGRTENWQRAVVGGEMVPLKAKRWLLADYETTQEMLAQAHFTWVGPYCPALERASSRRFTARAQELVRNMGYEFRLTQLKIPTLWSSEEAHQVEWRLDNDGVAPFYYPWPVQFALLDADQRIRARCTTGLDIREWLPGEHRLKFPLQFTAPPGDYQLAVGIIDPWQQKPAIRFANALPCVDGWTVLGTIQLTNQDK